MTKGQIYFRCAVCVILAAVGFISAWTTDPMSAVIVLLAPGLIVSAVMGFRCWRAWQRDDKETSDKLLMGLAEFWLLMVLIFNLKDFILFSTGRI